MVEAATGNLLPVAGDGQCGFGGDNGAGIFAQLNAPTTLALDAAGDWLYIADTNNNRLRRIRTGPGGIIYTLAGDGQAAFSPDGTAAAAAKLWGPRKVVVAPNGALVFSDTGNKVVRSIRFGSGGPCITAGGPPPPAGESAEVGGGEEHAAPVPSSAAVSTQAGAVAEQADR
jgi:sugar lactone lactonase YvrE